jgi:ectoine hydroxylase-related dioxygenase (phytanoyl-CoA dioxygenase family)
MSINRNPIVSQFDRDLYTLRCAGFAVIPAVFDAGTLDRLKKSAEAFQAEVDAYDSAGGEVIYKAGWPLHNARALYAAAVEFQDLIMHPSVQAFARAYLEQPRLRDCSFLTNMPDTRNIARGTAAPVNYHRDKLWLPDEMIRPNYLHCFVLLTDFTRENGATVVVPGTHRDREPGHYFLDNDSGEKTDTNYYPVFERRYFPASVQIEAARGSLLVFDPMIIHAQGINVSTERRSAIDVMFHRDGLPGIINCRAVAEKHGRVPVRSDLLPLLDSTSGKYETYGPLR